jgi:toxin secretion/phage lysis holin
MKAIWNIAQVFFAGAGGVLGWFIGGVDGFLFTLIAFVIVDYITGVLRAVVEKRLSSKVGAKGIVKKIGIFLVVGIAHLIDANLLGGENALRTAAIFFYISNEGISFFENAAAIGLPVPEKLKDVLAQLHEKTKSEPAGTASGDPIPPQHTEPEETPNNEEDK